MLSRRHFIGVTLGVSAGLAGCGNGSQGGSASGSAAGSGAPGGGEWIVGAYLSLSGAQSQFGIDTKEGIELAIDEINKDPPKGKKIKVLYEDDKSNAQETNNKVLQLIDRDKVVALLGEIASERSKSGGMVANRKKIPMISPSSTNPDVTKVGPYVFRVCFIDPFQGTAGAEFAINTLGKKKIGLLFATDDLYSSGLASEFKKAVANLGGEIVLEKSFLKSETNFTTYLQELKKAGPEIIYAPIYYDKMIIVARQASAEGIPLDSFLGGDGWSDPTLFQNLEGAYFSDHYAPDIPWDKSKKFVEEYTKRFKRAPTSLAAMGYDSALVLADAMRRAKGETPDAIKDAIAATKDFAGATGIITIDGERNALKPLVIVQIKGGTTVYKAIVGPGADKLLAGGAAPSPSSSASAEPAASGSAAPAAGSAAPAAGSAAPAAGSASPAAGSAKAPPPPPPKPG